MSWFTPPTSTPELLIALRSASTYAELACLSGSWEPYDFERRIFGRDWNKEGELKFRGTFHGPRSGTLKRPSQIEEIQELFPDSKLSWWYRNPLAEILCVAEIGQDGLLSALSTLPPGPERSLMWDENCVGIYSWERFCVEVPHSPGLIDELVRMGTPESLLVLIGRMRLSQLRGLGTDFDLHYERAIWEALPACLARSPHLYLGQRALLQALDRFLWWSPFADSRFLRGITDQRVLEMRQSFAERLQREVVQPGWSGLEFPPASQMEIRAAIVNGIVATSSEVA